MPNDDPYFTPDAESPRSLRRRVANYDEDAALDLIAQHESGGRNIHQNIVPAKGGYNPSVGRVTGSSSAQGPWQITNSTWRKRGPRDVTQRYPTAMSAPVEVQREVARKIYRETGFQDWAPYNASLRKAIAQGEQPRQSTQDQYFTPDPYFTPDESSSTSRFGGGAPAVGVHGPRGANQPRVRRTPRLTPEQQAQQLAQQVGGATINPQPTGRFAGARVAVSNDDALRNQIRRQMIAEQPAPLRTPWNEGQPEGVVDPQEVERRYQDYLLTQSERPEIDRVKAKLREFGGEGHGARLVQGIQAFLANSGVEAGNLIQGATLGKRGAGLTKEMRITQRALAELEAEDPNKGWLAAGERAIPQAVGEFSKMYTLQRAGVGKATLPALGVLSAADRGVTPAVEAGLEGALYQKGFEKIAPLRSRVAKFGIGASVPAAVSIAQGAEPKKAILSNLGFGALALTEPVPRGRQAPVEKPEVSTQVPDIEAKLAAREARVQPTFLRDEQGQPVARVLNPDEVAQGAKPKVRAIHQSDTQARDEAGKFTQPVSTTPPAEVKPPLPPSTALPESPEPATTPPPEAAQPASAETTAIPPSTTAPKDVAMQTDRAELGLPELERLPTVSAPEVLSKAKAENATNPRAPDVLVDQALRGGKNFTNVETMQVNLRAQEIKNRVNELNQEIYQATNPQEIAAKRAEQDGLIAEFDRISEAQDKAGAEWSRAGTARQRAITEDFSLVSMIARMKKAKGRELNPDERAKIEGQSQKIAQLEAQLAKAQEVAKTAALQKTINRISRTARRTATKATLDTEWNDLKAQFAQIKSQEAGFFKSESGAFNPEAVKVIASMARNRIRAGVTDAAQLVDEIHAALSEHIENLDKREVRDAISGYGREPQGDKRSEATKQLASIRSELKKLSASEDIEAGKRLSPRDKTRQTQLKKQEAELQRRLQARDFAKTEKPEPVPYTRETAAIQRRVDEIKRQFAREQYKATRTAGGKISDELAKAANVPKTIKSMGDISAVFRQGGFYAISHPIRGGVMPFRDMIKSFSDTGWRNVEQQIKNHPKYEQSVKDGVEYTGVNKTDPKLSKHEEGYIGMEYLHYVPVVKQIAEFSERTFVSFLDSQRLNMYDVMTDGLANPSRLSRLLGAKTGMTEAELKADRQRIAKAINSGTGRGNLGRRGNEYAPLLNVAMFSPRLLKSRVELLNNMFNPVAWANMPRNARAEILQDNVKFLAATIGVMALAKAAGGTVNTDPDDGDFLKIRFGDTTYDTLIGLQQPMRYAINMSRALSPVDSKTLQTGQYYAGETPWRTTGRFAESKAAPAVSQGIESLRGSDYLGRKRTRAQRALDFATPLPANDIIEAFKQDGLIGAVKATPTFTGIGVNTYPVTPDKPTTVGAKLAHRIVTEGMPDEARTQEEIDKDKARADLRARSRRGEDVSAEVRKMGLSPRQSKAILGARGKTRLEEDFKWLPLYDKSNRRDAITVYNALSPSEQAVVRDEMETKARNLNLLPVEDQAAVKQALESIGMTPGERRKLREPIQPRQPRQPKQGYVFK